MTLAAASRGLKPDVYDALRTTLTLVGQITDSRLLDRYRLRLALEPSLFRAGAGRTVLRGRVSLDHRQITGEQNAPHDENRLTSFHYGDNGEYIVHALKSGS